MSNNRLHDWRRGHRPRAARRRPRIDLPARSCTRSATRPRLAIVRALAQDGERSCGTFELGLSKATRSHHFKVLREAGVTHTRLEGTTRRVSLRRDDLDARFPGLLDAVLRG